MRALSLFIVPMLTQARELMRLVDRPEEYEIVRLSHGESSDAPLLGYDVGYWGWGELLHPLRLSYRGTVLFPRHSTNWLFTSTA